MICRGLTQAYKISLKGVNKMSVFQEESYNKRYDFELWKKLLIYVKPYKHLIFLLTFVMIAVGCVEATFPLMTKYAIDNFIVKGSLIGIESFLIKYCFLIIIQVINVWLLIAVAGKLEVKVCYDIRKNAFEHLQNLSFSYFDKTPVGWLMARMTSDIQKLSDTLAWGIVDFVWGFAMMLFISIYMFFLNWKLALVVLIVIPPLVVISMYYQKRILTAHREVRKTNSRITGAFNEGIMGAKTTKTLTTEVKHLNEFKDITGAMYKSSVMAAVLSSVYQPVVLTLGSIGTALALWIGGNGVIVDVISYGTLVVFISYTIQLFEPIRELARVLAEVVSAQASAERVVSMMETSPEVQDSPEVVNIYGDSINPKKENWPEIKGNIIFKGVSFEYKGGEKVLDNFNIDIKPGESIAFVGETGSGKSTIVNLACRFYEPTKGNVLIDGVDYRERSQLWLHSNLGYVLQTPHLFSGTIADNIRYGRLEASYDEVINAAKMVNAHEFITGLENGYDTDVGEGGNRLSTGQKQLISLARAILADPRIFVLDEATSSVDTETEQIIQNAINKVLKGRTSFIIAHRLSTIRSADRILVIDKGKVIEEGSHSTLLKKRGYYYKLYTNQFLEEQENKLLTS
jgi:ATP-binding cassette, subfamily B, bacterial